MEQVLPSSAEQKSALGMPRYIHHYIFVGSLALLVVGMPTSTFLTSLPQFILIGNWLLEGNLKNKMKSFFSNKVALVIVSFFLMHILGLLYTSAAGMDYGMEDIRKKLPLLFLPVIFSTSGLLMEKEKRVVILFFIIGVTYATFYGCYLLITHQFADIREISSFVDPVRQAMMQVLCFFLMVYYVFTAKRSFFSVLLLVWALWMVVYLFIMQSLTGVIMVVAISVALLIAWAFKQLKQKRMWYGFTIIACAASFVIGSIGYIVYFKHHYFPKSDKIEFSKLDKKTPYGNEYVNDSTSYQTENGHYVNVYVCWPELKKAWDERSHIPFESFDLKGNRIYASILRYMASKDLRKDADGVKQLSDRDVKAIEAGIPNYHFNSLTSMPYRIYQVFWELREYRHGGDANGHSLTQRFEFWKAATGIIKKHPLIGVGTGDVRLAFDEQYKLMNSTLDEKSRLRSHNQYLEIGVAFGIIGIIWFIITLWYPPFKSGKVYTYAYAVFWMIFMIAILTEDTLETQAGATFYAFFNSLFLFL